MDGKVLALMSAFCFGVNPIVLSLGLNKANSDVAVFVGLLSGLPVLLFVSPVAGGLEFGQLTWLATFYFVLGGLFGVFLGRAFLYTSIKKLGSSRASTFKNAGPVVTSLMALIFLNELVGVGRWMGIAMVTAGLMMVGQMARRAENPMTLS
ncbi:MAG: DMT family transporter, partial [Anaerolineae bacterium]